MDYQKHYPARGKSGILVAAGTATGIAAIADSKWVAQSFVFGWANRATSVTVGLFEQSASGSWSGTASLIFWQTMASAHCGLLNVYFGEVGYEASQTCSRLGVFIGNIVGSYSALVSGFYKGP